jgi:hypothetical protein
MDREKYIKEKAQYFLDHVVIEADPLDMHLIETLLDEIYQAGFDEAAEEK